MAADAPAAAPPPAAAGVGVDVGVGTFCDLKASMRLRSRSRILFWSSRAAAEVKVIVWFPATGEGSCTTILMEALAEVAGVCWRSARQSVVVVDVCRLGRNHGRSSKRRTANVGDGYGQWRRIAAGCLPQDRLAVGSHGDGAILFLVLGGRVGHGGGGEVRRMGVAWRLCELVEVHLAGARDCVPTAFLTDRGDMACCRRSHSHGSRCTHCCSLGSLHAALAQTALRGDDALTRRIQPGCIVYHSRTAAWSRHAGLFAVGRPRILFRSISSYKHARLLLASVNIAKHLTTEDVGQSSRTRWHNMRGRTAESNTRLQLPVCVQTAQDHTPSQAPSQQSAVSEVFCRQT